MEKIDRILTNLLILYKKVQSTNINIDDENRLLKIKRILGFKVDERTVEKESTTKTEKSAVEIQFIKLYDILSHKIQSTKGELISLIRDIGKGNINKFLDLDLIDNNEVVELISANWTIIIYGPSTLKPYRFTIHNLRQEENNIFRDNQEDPGNTEIHTQFLNYLTIKLGINEDKEKEYREVKEAQDIKSKVQVNETLILAELKEAEKEFDERILVEKIKTDLEMRIIVYPLINKGELIKRSQFSEFKGYLEKKTQYGPYIKSFPAQMFGNLEFSRDGLLYISKAPMIGSILIQRDGVVLYNWSYGEKKDPDRETLPMDYMSAYLLGFFNFLLKFYNKVNYLEDVKIIIKIRNIVNWKYSPHPAFIFDRPTHEFKHKQFSPFEKVYNIGKSGNKDVIYRTITEIFNEILLCYGISKEFKLNRDFNNFL